MSHQGWFSGSRVAGLLGSVARKSKRRRTNSAKPAESLESRLLLTVTNLGAISGTVYNDLTDNGQTMDDTVLAGATLDLYLDGGDLVFNNGGADDTLLGTTTSVAGLYSFTGLSAGRYFVRQQALAGFMQHTGDDVVTVDITLADAAGTAGTVIDDFANPGAGQDLSVIFPGTPTASSSAASATAIGGERDLFLEATAGNIDLQANNAAFPLSLNYDANFGATGRGSAIWDGVDGSTTLNPTGLGGVDLTAANETGFLLSLGSSAGITVTIIVHSNATDSSIATVPLAATAPDTFFVPYSTFGINAGAGADFASVGAIEFRIEAPVATTTTVSDLLQSHAPTFLTANFANFIPMTLGNIVFNDVNNDGLFSSGTESGIVGVTLTLFDDTNNNNGFDSGTDLLVAATTTAAGGLYSFGNLFPGDYIVQVDSGNFSGAGVLAGFQSSTGNGVAPDPDGDLNSDDNGTLLGTVVVSQAITLGNNSEPTNDGDADNNTNLSLDFGFFAATDLIVTKVANVATIIAGSGAGNLVYTVTINNAGLLGATGVTVTDTGVLAANLPAGVTLVSATGSGTTTFNSTTGVWTVGSLAPSASATLTVTLTVGATASDSLVINNTASLTTLNETDSDSTNNSQSTVTNVDRSVDIAVTKVNNINPVIAGSGAGNLVYTVTATNLGPSDASGLTLNDTDILAANLPAGVTLVSAAGSGASTFNTTTGVWTIGSLATGASQTLVVTLTVGASASDSLVINNTASLATVTETDFNPLNNSQSVVTNVDRSVDIAVTKTNNISPVIAGSGVGNLIYTVTATNSGPSDATGVMISDLGVLSGNLPAGVTFVSATGSGSSTFSSTTGLWTIGNLTVGDSRTLTITLTVAATASDSLVISNTASLNAVAETDSNSNNNSQTITTDVNRSVDIVVTKTGTTGPIIAGSGAGNLVYVVTATNAGPSNASGVVISDPDVLLANLPVGVTFVSAVGSGSSTFSTTTGLWTIGDLDVGSSRTLIVTLTVGSSAADNLTINNLASLDDVNESDSNANNNSQQVTTVVDRRVDIAVTKVENINPVIAGSGTGNLVYTVTATNLGPSNASGLTLSDIDVLAANLPVGVTLVSATGTGGSTYSSTTGLWTIGDLDVGVSRTLTVVLTVAANASDTLVINNTASLSSVNETDSNANNNSQRVMTAVDRRVDIAVTKLNNINPVIAGSGAGNLVYTVTATNNGPSNASGVAIADLNVLAANLPAGVSFVSAAGTGGSTFNATTGLWTIGNLDTGASRTLTLTLTVSASASDSLVINNTASVSTVNEIDSIANNNSQSVATNVDRRIDIAVTKTQNANTIVAGSGAGNLVYTVTATNAGLSDASGVVIRDLAAIASSLPAGVTFVSAAGSGGSTFSSTTGLWTIGAMTPGESRTLTITLTVGSSASDSLVMTNTAALFANNETDTVATNNSQTVTANVDRSVDIVVTKVNNAAVVIAGSGAGNLVYTITATNAGPSDASGVTIVDTGVLSANLPSGVSFVSAVGSNGSTFNTTTGIWTIGTLARGTGRSLTVTLTVGSTTVNDQVINNTAQLSTVTEIDSNANNNSQTVTSRVERHVDVAITKADSSDPAFSPGQLTYTIVVTNNGPSQATGVVMTDTLASGTTFVSSTSTLGTITHSGGVVSATISTLNAGASATFTIVTSLNLPSGGNLLNIASVRSTEIDDNLGNNSAAELTTIEPTRSSIAGFVFQDLNSNQLRDVAEKALQSVSIVLFGVDILGTNVVRRTTTDANGAYAFTSLLPGNYNVYEVQPNFYFDNNEVAGTPITPTIVQDAFLNLALTGGVSAVNFNFTEGAYDSSKRPFLASSSTTNQQRIVAAPAAGGTGSVSGTVAIDANRSGSLDSSDTRIPAAIVTLAGMDNAGNPIIIHRTTDASGNYSFSNLPAGQYSVAQTQPSQYADGPEQPGSLIPDETLDNLFALMSLPDGIAATGFNFLELPSTPAGAVPSILTPAITRASAQPTVSWTPVAGAASYEIQINQVTGGVGTVVTKTGIVGTSWTVATKLVLGNHKVWVRAVDAAGVAGAWSLPVSFAASPVATTSLPGRTTIDSTPIFDWTDISNATSYDLKVTNISNGQTVLDLSGLTTSKYTATVALPVGNYRYFVRGKNADVTGNWSPGHEFSVSGAPVTRTTLRLTTPTPTLQWDPVSGAVRYDIWLDDLNGTAPQQITTVSTSPTNALSVPVALNLGNYRYYVRAVDAAGNRTAWSTPSTFTVAAAPTLLSPATNISDTTPTFTWTAVPGATRYDLWVSNRQTGLFVREQNVVGTSHTFTTVFPAANYRVWVQAIGANATGAWSQALDFTVHNIAAPTLNGPPATTSNVRPTITWTSSTGAVRYELWVDKVGGPTKVINLTNLTATSYTPTANLATGTYRAWVRAVNSVGVTSNWSTLLQFTIV